MSATAQKRILELDGIRGIAILLVLMFHLAHASNLPVAASLVINFGWIGVDLFFILSGFLITGILLEMKGSQGYFRTFYWHRVLRIFPLYYAFLLGILLLTPVLAVPLWKQAIYWVYLSNLLNASGQSISYMRHFWSLAIEEQFYLIWPMVVLWTPSRHLARLCALLIGGVVIARFLTVQFRLFHFSTREAIYVLTPLRFDALLFGAFIAWMYHFGLLERARWAVKWVAGAGAVFLAAGFWTSRGAQYVDAGIEKYGYFGIDLLFAAAIAGCVIWSGAANLSPLRSGFLRFFGKYSYGIYVLHLPIRHFLVPIIARNVANPIALSLAAFSICTVLSVAAALISWNLIEKRFIAMKTRPVPRLWGRIFPPEPAKVTD